MSYRGDIALGSTIDIKFTTRRFSTGAPFTFAGSPAVAAYVDNGTTEITAGITLSVDFDGRTGLNNVRVVATSGNGFATATNVSLVVTAGTVDSVSVVGEVVGSFSIEARSGLRPTTAGRTLDVSAGGEAGVDWANIGSPTTAQTLSATTIATSQVVASVSGAVGSVTGSVGSVVGAVGSVTGAVGSVTGNVGGNVTGAVGSVAANGIAATSIATGAITAAKFAANAIDAAALAADAGTEIGVAVWANATGAAVSTNSIAIKAKTDNLVFTTANQVDSRVMSMAAGVVTAAAVATDAIDSDALAADALAEIKVQVVASLATDTYAEPGQGNPPATTTLANKIGYIFKGTRNKHNQNATTFELYADDGTTVDQKATVSDDGTTFSRGKLTTGP